MRVYVWTLAAAIATTIAVIENCVFVNAISNICESTSCQTDGGGHTCDRLNQECPPCLHEKSMFVSKILCLSLTSDGECPEGTMLCSSAVEPFDSSSGSGPEPPPPTTFQPTTAPAVVSNSSSGSGSSSNQTTTKPIPTTDTPELTVSPSTMPPKPKPTAPKAATPKPAVTEKVATDAPISQANSNASNGNDSHPNSQMPTIIGIAGGAFVLVAAVMFFIWKRRQDDDEESDDEGGYRYDPPKPAYNAPAVTKSSSTNAKSGPSATAAGSQSFGTSGASTRRISSNQQYTGPSSFDESQRSLYLDDLASSHRGIEQQRSTESMGSEWDTAEFGGTSFKQRRTSSNASVEF